MGLFICMHLNLFISRIVDNKNEIVDEIEDYCKYWHTIRLVTISVFYLFYAIPQFT